MGSLAAPLVGHIDVALTNFAKKFSNNELIADRIAPPVGVGRQADRYYIYGREGQELTEVQLRRNRRPGRSHPHLTLDRFIFLPEPCARRQHRR